MHTPRPSPGFGLLASIAFAARRRMSNVPIRLIAITRSNVSRACGPRRRRAVATPRLDVPPAITAPAPSTARHIAWTSVPVPSPPVQHIVTRVRGRSQHGLDSLARAHRSFGLVDVFERVFRHEPVERQAALAPELDESRDELVGH